ncbi:MAG: pyruvate kinase, partial [Planctomycetes bacterium]|nr:pyruvate kinase [Planctomycetota bacterium]
MLTTKTKIVATTGPSCSDVEAIASLIDDGVDVFRLNFSHGDFKTHASILKAVNEARSRFTHSIAVAGDLCGPKIRVGKIDPDGEMLDEGDEVTISNAIETGNAHSFGT